MLNRMICGAALLGLMAVGCATFQPGQTVVKYERGGTVRLAEAPEDGKYALFSGTDVRNPEVSYQLSQGDKLGFTERDGAVYAVAGNNETKIETSTMTRSYFWRRQK